MTLATLSGVGGKDLTLFRKLVNKSITEVTAEDLTGVTSIGKYAFSNCSSLVSVSIPNGVTVIDERAFNDCSNLTTVLFSNSVTTIGKYCFMRCSKLATANLPLSITIIGDYAFANCSYLTTVEIPYGVTVLNQYVLYGCSRLTKINLPNSITSIGDYAISTCNALQSIVIPNSVINIASAVFTYSGNLKKIVVTPTTPPTLASVNAFTNINANAIFYIPLANISSYTGATNWIAVLTTYTYAPLVSTIADLSNIDTATYVKACVVGADESYKEYTYDGSQWNEVV